MTTWGDLRAGDVILDKTSTPWTVVSVPSATATLPMDPAHAKVTVRAMIQSGNRTSIPVVKPASEPVTVVRPDVSVEEQAKVIQGAFPDTKVIVDEPGPEVLPHIPDALSLRSHLYLCHSYPMYEAVDAMMLGEHHRRQHFLEAEGKGAEGYAPHVHEETETTVVDRDGFGRTVVDDGR